MGKKIKVGLIGIGNCFSGLIQGIEFYAQNPSQSITGIIHEKLRDYGIHDIEFVCGFDVGENKVGKKINEAIYEKPNMVNWIPKESKRLMPSYTRVQRTICHRYNRRYHKYLSSCR